MSADWQIGDVRITRIDERCDAYPPGDMLPDATEEALRRHADWLAPHFVDAAGHLLVSVHALGIESEGRKILVDTCIGETAPPEAPVAPEPTFLDRLEAAGFGRESVDLVLCTHLHFDHVGWNTLLVGDRYVPTFPKARYLFARREWAYWNAAKEPGFASTLEERVRPIVDAGLSNLVETDHRLTSEVRLVSTPGHTPGHVSVAIESLGERAFITGDMVFHPVQWAEPAWSNEADEDPLAATERRCEMREHLASTRSLVIGTHFAPPTAGWLEAHAGRWRLRPP